MALHHERILCHGQEAWALDQADGTYKCSCGCGRVFPAGVLVQTGGTWPARHQSRPAFRHVAGFELDWSEVERERHERDVSQPDFTKPYGEAA